MRAHNVQVIFVCVCIKWTFYVCAMTIIAKICPLLRLVGHDNYLYIHLRLFYWSKGGLYAKVCVTERLDGCVMIFTL